MSTPAAPSHCPQNVLCVCACVCVGVCVSAALLCQNATCSSWLQLNGKLEILTIDLVVRKWLEICSREELLTSPFTTQRGDTFIKDWGLSRKAPHHHQHHLLSVIWGYANIMRVKTHKTSRNTTRTIKNWSCKTLIWTQPSREINSEQKRETQFHFSFFFFRSYYSILFNIINRLEGDRLESFAERFISLAFV